MPSASTSATDSCNYSHGDVKLISLVTETILNRNRVPWYLRRQGTDLHKRGDIFTFQFNLRGEILDTIAKLAGKWGTWLGIKKNRYAFLIHTGCCIYWVIIDIHRNLWAQALFTVPTIALQLYGFYRWSEDDKVAIKG